MGRDDDGFGGLFVVMRSDVRFHLHGKRQMVVIVAKVSIGAMRVRRRFAFFVLFRIVRRRIF